MSEYGTERKREILKSQIEVQEKIDKINNFWNVIFFENDTVYFYGFKKLKKHARISDSEWGTYIIPGKDLKDARHFELVDHKTRDETLVKYIQKNGAFNYHFTLVDGRYYKSHICILRDDVDFYSQFPESV